MSERRAEKAVQMLKRLTAAAEFLCNGEDLDQAVNLLLQSHFYVSHSDRMVNNAMDLVETVS